MQPCIFVWNGNNKVRQNVERKPKFRDAPLFIPDTIQKELHCLVAIVFPEIGRIYIESRRVTAAEAAPEAALAE